MRLVVVLSVAWVACSTSSLSISHQDLEEGNRTCDGRESCEDVHEETHGPTLWMGRNCLCDENCVTYGDCCPDSPHFELQQQRRGAISFHCENLRQYGGIYMRTTCPPEWAEPNIRAACENASDNVSDPIAGIPATHQQSGITYRNLFCAICHQVTIKELDFWNPDIECSGIPRKMDLNISELLYFHEENKYWGIDFEGRYHYCFIDPTPSNATEKLIRRCIPDVIKTCAVNWTDAEVRKSCEAYTSIVYDSDNVVYRNRHCGICNRVEVILCTRILFRGGFDKTFSRSAFSVLFDLSRGPPGMTQLCDEEQLYDPFYKRCRNVLQEFRTTKNIRAMDVSIIENTTDASLTVPFLKCKKFTLQQDDYMLDDNGVYVSKYRKRFREGEFNIYEDGRLEICADKIGIKTIEKFDPYMGYITFAGLGISIIFLLLHLAAFCLVPDLRNLSGKNMASLCLALLIAYISFVAGRFFQGNVCLVIAVLTFYSFLASFTWMLTMSFDVWRTLRKATSELRVCSGKQWSKFIVYSLWSWLVPVLIVMLALWAELSSGIRADWRPGFAATNSCWFGRSKPLLVLFAVPLAIVMLLNIVFFASSAHMVYSSTSTTRFMASASTKRDFRMYLRLVVVMGLTWTTGLIAGTLDFDLLWYLFILLNTLQGLFIFLAFTCNDKVIRHLAAQRQSKFPRVIPRSFSWSTDSTIKKSQVESEQTLDTFY
ncbi:unnamed protein product [Nezara viridula]|uniref:G-protein coupled receptors family 2 profile 2 domain-containing protein n=1 Tax=Nezara viridula TaxID=85310 RepID=A0A9P0HMS4_NEZVI|nr:unnamed protein product [Nezara viridula]